MPRRSHTKVDGIASTFLVCSPSPGSSSPDSCFNLNTNRGTKLRVVVCNTFHSMLSALLINSVHRESKSSSLGKRYILSFRSTLKMGPHVNIIIVACCPFRPKHQHRCPRSLPVCIHIPLYVFIGLNISRIGSLDWQFSNITASSTYQFVGPSSELKDGDQPVDKNIFEMRGMHPFKPQ